MAKEIVMNNDQEAAQYRTGLSGWVSRRGRFFGDSDQSESMARYDGCTHVECRYCGDPTPKGWLACVVCRDKLAVAKYNSMPRKTWDGVAMLYSEARDEYFNDLYDAEDSLEDGETLADLMMVICDPEYAKHIDEDYFSDDLPEGGEIPSVLKDAIDAFNKVIDNSPPLSWFPGKYALNIEDHNRIVSGE